MHVAFKRGSCAFMSVCPVLPRSPLAVRRLCRQRRDPRGRWRGCAAAADVLLPQVSPSFPDEFLYLATLYTVGHTDDTQICMLDPHAVSILT